MTDTAFQLCSLPRLDPFELPGDISQPRAEAIRLLANKWDNGTVLTYHFLQSPNWDWPEAQKAVVRKAFEAWKNVGIGLSFHETATANGATLLIGRLQDNRSWSWVGTDVLRYRDRGRNMNFGWDLTTPWGGSTALHEIGHAIGMPHEHQNPHAGIVWNEDAVLEYYKGEPNNWKEDAIRHNILRKLDPAEVEGSTWDKKSIMHYPFKAGLITAPPDCVGGTPDNYVLSHSDAVWVARFYPMLNNPAAIEVGARVPLPRETGERAAFAFTATEDRDHVIYTEGASDTRLVLEGETDTGWSIIAEADDAAQDRNARMVVPLKAGRGYIVSARTYFAGSADEYLLAID